MKNAFNRLRSGMETLNLTMLLILNLFFMVFLLLAVCTVLVLAGVDEGFFYHDGQVELGGALAFVYTRLHPDRCEHGGDDTNGLYPPIAAEH